jgi:hypothetical protein
MMSFLREDDKVAVQAKVTSQSTQRAAAVALEVTDSVHNRNVCMREIVENLQKSHQ